MTESRWIGGINGSRIGHVFWTENEEGVGRLTLGQINGTTVVFSIMRQSQSSDHYSLSIAMPDTDESQLVGELQVEVGNQSLRSGTWKLNDGSAGTFEVVIKELGEATTTHNPLEGSQVQISNKDVPLGAITIYRSDLHRIINELESYYNTPVIPIIRAKEGGQVIVKNAAEYLGRGDLPDKLHEFTITIEANSDYGLKKVISLVLSDNLDSKIFVSSPDELWTEAVAQRLTRYMDGFTSTFTGFLRRHGLNINTVFLVVLIIALPEFDLVQRLLITLLVIFLILLVVRSMKLVPYARIYLDPDRIRKPYAKELPSVILGLVASAATITLTALPKISDWLTDVLHALVEVLSK